MGSGNWIWVHWKNKVCFLIVKPPLQYHVFIFEKQINKETMSDKMTLIYGITIEKLFKL